MERFGPTRRGGPVFRWLGEPLAIDLANTVMVVREGQTVDLLMTAEDLRRWLEAEEARLGECAFAVAHLDEIRRLRDAVRRLLRSCALGTPPLGEDLARVNAASAAAPVALHTEPALDGTFALVERTAAPDLLARLQGTIARSAIGLLTGPQRELLHVCEAPSCGMLFVGGRQWCCTACGNRARAARHYRRTRARA